MTADELIKIVSVIIQNQHMEHSNSINEAILKRMQSPDTVQHLKRSGKGRDFCFAICNRFFRNVSSKQMISPFQYGSGIPPFPASYFQHRSMAV